MNMLFNPMKSVTNRSKWAQPILKIWRHILLTLTLFLFASAATADLYDDYINSTSKLPFITFLARDSDGFTKLPGHAFVGLGVDVEAGLRVYEKLLGYYPKNETFLEEIKASYSRVSGRLDAKFEDVLWKVEYRVRLTEAQRMAVQQVIDRWMANDPKYSLTAFGGKNCNVLAAEIARAISLKIPANPGTTLPVLYIAKMKQMNGG